MALANCRLALTSPRMLGDDHEPAQQNGGTAW
jgi:hypothetical protein